MLKEIKKYTSVNKKEGEKNLIICLMKMKIVKQTLYLKNLFLPYANAKYIIERNFSSFFFLLAVLNLQEICGIKNIL